MSRCLTSTNIGSYACDNSYKNDIDNYYKKLKREEQLAKLLDKKEEDDDEQE